MFTSELREIGLVCDRAAVLHNGRIVAELPADAGEQRCCRPPTAWRSDVASSRHASSSFDGATTTAADADVSRLSRFARRQGWTFGVAVLLVVLLLWRVSQLPRFGDFEIRTITAGTMALAFLAMAQGVVVISGGIDLSVGSMMVFANCLSALWMEDQGFGACLALAVAVLVVTVALSTLTGVVITASGVPDIIVTLAASFILAGLALFVIGGPGGGTSPDFQQPRRRRAVGLLAVGAVDRRRPRCWCGSRCAAAASGWRSTPSAATARRRSCPASTSPGPGCWPTRSAGCSPGSPASSSRPRPAAASPGRRSARTPR